MFTPYAVMSPSEYDVARRLFAGAEFVRQYDKHLRTRMLNKKWITYANFPSGVEWWLTPEGGVAFEMRQILGPDRELTKAQAGYLTTFGLTPSMHRKLVTLGLIEDTPERRLTEDGQKIKALLVKNGVRFT